MLLLRPKADHLINYNFISYKTEEEHITSANLKFTNGKSETPGGNGSEFTEYITTKAGSQSFDEYGPSTDPAPASFAGAGESAASMAFTTFQGADLTIQRTGGEI